VTASENDENKSCCFCARICCLLMFHNSLSSVISRVSLCNSFLSHFTTGFLVTDEFMLIDHAATDTGHIFRPLSFYTCVTDRQINGQTQTDRFMCVTDKTDRQTDRQTISQQGTTPPPRLSTTQPPKPVTSFVCVTVSCLLFSRCQLCFCLLPLSLLVYLFVSSDATAIRFIHKYTHRHR
jgi:hypothetical protein